MPFEATVGEPMKAIAHNEQLEAPPGCLGGVEAVGIVDLPTELADDPLDDVGSPRHPWMIEVGEEKFHLVLEGEDLPLQPTVPESSPSSFPNSKPEAEVLLGGGVEEPGGQGEEGVNSPTRASVEVAEVVMEVALRVADAELQGKTGTELPAGAPQTWVPVQDESCKGIAHVPGDTLEQGLPECRRLHRSKAGQRDILRGGIGAEKNRPSFSPDIDGFAVEQEVAPPGGLKFLGNLHKALTVLSQGIDPLEDPVGAHVEFSSHSAVGGLSVEVEMRGPQAEAGFISVVPRCSLALGREGPLTVITPPAPNLAYPPPRSCPAADPIGGVSLGAQPSAFWTPFFSPSSPPMVCIHTIERPQMSKIIATSIP